MSRPAIEIRHLTKVYGEKRALDGVRLEVAEGSVYGFLGPNGAGKTTTLRILTGLARPTSGRALIFGHDVVDATNEVRAQIGFLPDVPGFYDWMSAREFLALAGSLFGIERRALDQRIEVLLDLAGLTDVKQKVGGYSRGMKQRLGIAQALINAPKLLMLDEPTSALDPIGRKEVLDMIAALGGRTTVFFSTHILADVERVCDTVAILADGRVVAQAPMDELLSRAGADVMMLEVGEGTDELASALESRSWLRSLERVNGTLRLNVSDLKAAQMEVPRMVVDRGLPLKRFEAGELGLEEAFVDLVGGERQ